ncbi:MAG TPA: efflux RND transporter permease subunit [bacterium]|nr:efflux RND transporter permease subunit [bacterium]
MEAAKIRFRPIFLTTITTAAGLLPLAYGVLGNKDAFLQPIALVFAWGLIFSTIVTLFIIPVFLSVYHGGKEKTAGMKSS